MLVAKPDGNNFIIADYRSLFPEWCFNANGPEQEWYEVVGCYPVSTIKSFDSNTQILENSEPYLENGVVYTVVAVDIPPVDVPPAPPEQSNTTPSDPQ